MNETEKRLMNNVNKLWRKCTEARIEQDKQYPYGLDKQWEIGEGK